MAKCKALTESAVKGLMNEEFLNKRTSVCVEDMQQAEGIPTHHRPDSSSNNVITSSASSDRPRNRSVTAAANHGWYSVLLRNVS